jgi:hypothetical protein
MVRTSRCPAACSNPLTSAPTPAPTPGREQSYHWGYYSCNGFTPDIPRPEVEKKWKGLEPLWRDVMERHKALPLHVLVRRGGGGGGRLRPVGAAC